MHQRPEGAAFFKATRDLYRYSATAYLAVNIAVPGRRHYMHCAYSDSDVRHCVSAAPVSIAALADAGLAGAETVDWAPAVGGSSAAAMNGGGAAGAPQRGLAFGLRPRAGETAVFGIACDMSAEEWERHKAGSGRDVRILADYFHSHVLRINGYDAAADMLVSARELDCLKWTAAGKTAWEASVILGISERTVRFHLNAAREKLGCATTAQAVAKAVRYQLIDV